MDVATMEVVRSDTERWLECAVIGLNLCPFAKAVHIKKQIHYAVCASAEPEQLLQDLQQECAALLALPSQQRETTLLMTPHCLQDFYDFNDFLAHVDAMLAAAGWEGVLQVASFHPDYQFAGTAKDDVTNRTNWAPYPTLHILREESIGRAVQVFPEAEQIYEKNIATMEALGHEGWHDLGLQTTVAP